MSEVKDDEEWWNEIQPRTHSAIKVPMEVEMLEELHAGRYRRTEFRRDYRNGYRTRVR